MTEANVTDSLKECKGEKERREKSSEMTQKVIFYWGKLEKMQENRQILTTIKQTLKYRKNWEDVP